MAEGRYPACSPSEWPPAAHHERMCQPWRRHPCWLLDPGAGSCVPCFGARGSSWASQSAVFAEPGGCPSTLTQASPSCHPPVMPASELRGYTMCGIDPGSAPLPTSSLMCHPEPTSPPL